MEQVVRHHMIKSRTNATAEGIAGPLNTSLYSIHCKTGTRRLKTFTEHVMPYYVKTTTKPTE